jgi:hypothetical protein
MNKAARGRIDRNYEGPEVLSQLLEVSGCGLTHEEVVDEFECAVEEGTRAHDIIPLLWEESEPAFPDAASARRTFGNLFALFDLIASDAVADLIQLPEFDPNAPISPEHAEKAWSALDELSDNDVARAVDRFENCQPEISNFVQERLDNHSDLAIECALSHAFEAWWILDHLRSEVDGSRASREALSKAFDETEETAEEAEPALAILVTTGLWEQAAHEEHPLAEDSIPVIERVLQAVRQALRTP